MSELLYEAEARQGAAFAVEVRNLAPPRLSKSMLESLFAIPIIRNACSELPESIAGAGWKIGFDGDEGDTKGINANLTKWEEAISSTLAGEEPPKSADDVVGLPRNFASIFKTAQITAAIYGGAAIIIVAEDGVPYNEPINLKGLKTIRRLVVMDKYRITPLHRGGSSVSDPLHYQLSLSENDWGTRMEDTSGTIHHSRIIRFDGVPTPPDKMILNGGWGDSVIECIIRSYMRYIRILDSSAASAENHRLLTLKIKDLNGMMKRGRSTELQNKMTNMKMWIDLMSAIPLDADAEDAGYINNSFTGLDAITQQARDHYIGETNIPHDKLFGESPSGLGATGDAERSNWAETTDNHRVTDWKPKLRKLYKLCFHCQQGPTKGRTPKAWEISFNDLIQPTPGEITEQQAAEASADIQRVEAKIITPKEARSRLQQPDYESGLTLDDTAWEEEQSKAEEAEAKQKEAQIEGLKNPGQPPQSGATPPEQAEKEPQSDNEKLSSPENSRGKNTEEVRGDAAGVGAYPRSLEYVESSVERDPELWSQALSIARGSFRSPRGGYVEVYAASLYRQLEAQRRQAAEGMLR